MVDEEVFVTKLQQINRYTGDLKEMRGQARVEYVNDVRSNGR
jgi:hypothetical protein